MTTVRVGSGYEAATLGQGNTVTFWHFDGRSWTKDGSSTHLPVRGSEPIEIIGTRLPGAGHATFILDGAFTGDSTGQAIAYGKDHRGWSVLTRQPNGSLAPSGHGLKALGGPGLELEMSFIRGHLRVSSMWGPQSTEPFAGQSTHPVVRSYKASGRGRLAPVRSNVSAGKATDPWFYRMPVPLDSVPNGSGPLPDGTWVVEATGLDSSVQSWDYHDMGALQPMYRPNQDGWYIPIGGARTARFTDGGDYRLMSDPERPFEARSVTAPLWAFGQVLSGTVTNARTYSGSPYRVPSAVTAWTASRLLLLTVHNGVVTQADQMPASH